MSGLRISEALALTRDDVDLQEGLLTIRGTKFGKSRLVPLHASTRRALARYAQQRDASVRRPLAANFLLCDSGRPPEVSTVRRVFYQLSRQTGLRGPSDRRGPRLQDFRHNSGTRIIPSTDRQGGFLWEIAQSRTQRWRHNQSVFRKAKTRSLGRYRGVRARVAVVLARACSLSCISACKY